MSPRIGALSIWSNKLVPIGQHQKRQTAVLMTDGGFSVLEFRVQFHMQEMLEEYFKGLSYIPTIVYSLYYKLFAG